MDIKQIEENRVKSQIKINTILSDLIKGLPGEITLDDVKFSISNVKIVGGTVLQHVNTEIVLQIRNTTK